jgi:hypothetical protein
MNSFIHAHSFVSPWCPLHRRLGGPQSQSGHSGEEKNYQPLPGLKLPIIHPSTILLSYPGSAIVQDYKTCGYVDKWLHSEHLHHQ